jgi:ABC-2 type transport system permease protein
MSFRDFRAVYPPRVYLLTTLPRVVLQAAFLALIGYYAAGEEGREFAFIGACAQIIVLATMVRGPDVLIDDRIMGTLYRVRLGFVPLPAIAAARWWIYVVAGWIDALLAVVVVGTLVGEAHLIPELLAAAPLFLLIAITTSALGLTVAAVSLTERVDFLLANFVAYIAMVFCGVVAPITVFGDAGETLVRLLPLTNGLLAVRAFVADEPWVADAALEAAVGAGWMLVAVVLLGVQTRRARRLGTDDIL